MAAKIWACFRSLVKSKDVFEILYYYSDPLFDSGRVTACTLRLQIEAKKFFLNVKQ